MKIDHIFERDGLSVDEVIRRTGCNQGRVYEWKRGGRVVKWEDVVLLYRARVLTMTDLRKAGLRRDDDGGSGAEAA